MAGLERMEAAVDNPCGSAPILLVCDHASNFVPPVLAGLGLNQAHLTDHVAWDVGAHGLARRLSVNLDAPLVSAPASRLIVDPNRDLAAPDLIPKTAEGVVVPGNAGLSETERRARIDAFHAPYHDAIDAVLAARADIAAVVSIHSFTPVLLGDVRPWHAGVLHRADARLADVMIGVLTREAGLIIGRNKPYAPEDGVFYTLDRHGRGRATAMVEVRNDLIGDDIGQAHWAQRLADAVKAGVASLDREAREMGAIGGRN
jgi:predicted N-formylglutamate amidohydrolase